MATKSLFIIELIFYYTTKALGSLVTFLSGGDQFGTLVWVLLIMITVIVIFALILFN